MRLYPANGGFSTHVWCACVFTYTGNVVLFKKSYLFKRNVFDTTPT